MDKFLVFHFEVCDILSGHFLPSKSFYFFSFALAYVTDSWWPMVTYIGLMIFAVSSVCLGKFFPNTIGIPVTRFYKRHASSYVFHKYCGNSYGAIGGTSLKI